MNITKPKVLNIFNDSAVAAPSYEHVVTFLTTRSQRDTPLRETEPRAHFCDSIVDWKMESKYPVLVDF